MEGEAGASVACLCRNLAADLAAIPGATLDYTEIVDEVTLLPLKEGKTRSRARIMVAVCFGHVRLIDNLPMASSR